MKEQNIEWKPQPLLAWYENLLSGSALVLLLAGIIVICISIYFTKVLLNRSKNEKTKIYKKHKQELATYFIGGFVALALSVPSVVYCINIMEQRTEANYIALSKAIENEYNVKVSPVEVKQLLHDGKIKANDEIIIAEKTFDSVEIEIRES